jgi:hypothetical protein
MLSVRARIQPKPAAKMVRVESGPSRVWGVILAGGEGVRLRSLTRSLCGDERPKQYATLLGARSLLRPGSPTRLPVTYSASGGRLVEGRAAHSAA